MSVASVLARGRAAAEALMVDTCVIDHNEGETVDDINVTDDWQPVYTGKCRVQIRVSSTEAQLAGEQLIDILRTELQLPLATTGINVNDRVTITASTDADLVGRVMYVAQLMHKTHATARRLPLKETTS